MGQASIDLSLTVLPVCPRKEDDRVFPVAVNLNEGMAAWRRLISLDEIDIHPSVSQSLQKKVPIRADLTRVIDLC